MTTAALRRHALSIFRAALAAANPADAVRRHLERVGVSRFRNVYVVGAGKAGASMAAAAERVLGRRITAGCVNVKDPGAVRHGVAARAELDAAQPDRRGEEGARRIRQIAEAAERRDLVVCLISGGASALMPLSAPPVTLGEKQAATELLLRSGANIHEINTIRKHISLLKGGQLARLAAPARLEALLLSDVIGDDPGVIGSGPATPDATRFADALRILDRYRIRASVPASLRERFEQGARGEIPETPKPADPAFARVRNVVIGSNRLALAAAARRARQIGFRTLVLSSEIQGEAREIARMHAAIAREIALRGRPVRAPACVITGGETTVTLRGDGLGGRNQEFALAAALDISGLTETVVFSAGTDGTDGPTHAAGAFADGSTVSRKPDALAYLERNDSYHYFESLGDLVETGPTHTNVMDVHLILVGSQPWVSGAKK